MNALQTPTVNHKLLTYSNAKTVKGEKKGYLTAILYLAPHTVLEGQNVCPYATKGCSDACLYTAGRGRFSNVQKARLRKSILWKENKEEFLASLNLEISKVRNKAERKGLIPAIRLNGTSDIPWEKYGIIQQFPELQFYTYTKWPLHARLKVGGGIPDNYHITYSWSDNPKSELYARQWYKAGYNTAVVFSGPLPTSFMDIPVIDGDETDLRFLDPTPVIVGLKAKGSAKQDTTGFVIHESDPRCKY